VPTEQATANLLRALAVTTRPDGLASLLGVPPAAMVGSTPEEEGDRSREDAVEREGGPVHLESGPGD
jgi:hypothetical protein